LQPLLRDKQCTNDNIAFQPELHLQQKFLLLCPKPYKHPKTTKLNLNNTKQKGNGNKLPLPFSLEHHHKKTMAHCFRFLLLKHKENKTHKKTTTKKTRRREGAYLQTPTLPSHFWLPLLHFRFKCFFLASFSSQIKKIKIKTIEQKINVEKGKSLPSRSCSTFSLLTPASTLPLLHFCFKRFLLASSSSQAEEKKNTHTHTQRKKKP